MLSFHPNYLRLYESGELAKSSAAAVSCLASCTLCPRQCKVNRLQGEKGYCQTGRQAIVASYTPHFGEETPLVGRGGSGTIFFSGCNLGCVFCQNYELSHNCEGAEVSGEQLAAIMLSLQEQECHNINFVTPTHVVPQILEALVIAAGQALTLPLVYNTSGYDRQTTLTLLDGIIDIYMPDFKFWRPESAKKYCRAPDYPEIAQQAVLAMHRQVGDLRLNSEGLAYQGLLIRHLVMPGGLEETGAILDFIANRISQKTYVNVMDQYRPCGKAKEYEAIKRSLLPEEYRQALEMARLAGLTRLDERNWQLLLRRLGIF